MIIRMKSLHLELVEICKSVCYNNFRLKRTTDVMFGGKQVLVCGYGEVGF